MDTGKRRKVAVLGCGFLGQFLAEKITKNDYLELVCVWDRDITRSNELLKKLPDAYFTECIENVKKLNADIVVEVAHPDVTRKFGKEFLGRCDYMIGSPSALADETLHSQLLQAATMHSLYVPSGAFWGGEDIRKMADLDTLEGLRVTMQFHPHSLKLTGPLKEVNDKVTKKSVLYEGAVRGVCEQAAKNVNSMAAACISGHNLGFDRVQGCLISNPALERMHVVEVEVWGRKDAAGEQFHVHTRRCNPASPGHVTGSATLDAFFASLLRAHSKGPGIHLC